MPTTSWSIGHWIISAIVLAGIIHISTVLLIPYLAPNNAWARLSAISPNNMQVLAPADSKTPSVLPMLSPDVRYAVCRYDISKGPVMVTAELPDSLWSISIYNRFGDNFYVLRGKDLKLPLVRMKLFQKKKTLLDILRGGENKVTQDDEISVDVGDLQGIVLIRAPLTHAAFDQKAISFLSNASCTLMQSVTRHTS